MLENWGRPKDRLNVRSISIDKPGRYALRIVYNNHAQAINTGIANAVKRARFFENERVVGEGVVQMPSVELRGNENPFRESTPVFVDLKSGVYRIELSDYFNMSYLQANATYAGAGGKNSPRNTANIAGFGLERISVYP